ncbi:hypothetical protein E0Z10_g8441 [Xylaria hypoxylon]|uniref:Xylanolytic transcriptional activator regulatory domain-containing protein n=1 Tax=Xylaria hypoxylon TaxID=37992 RepID=A0A4Z0YS33_9PEZI|nr:hypothetical protein E0Z10_g8441 [Xylaria hypoxylon]
MADLNFRARISGDDPAQPPEKQDDLLGRIHRLEGFVAKLGSEFEGRNHGGETSFRDSTQALNSDTSPRGGSKDGFGAKHSRTTTVELDHITDELGTLVMHNNESLYVGSWLWGAIYDEVKHIRQAVEDSSIESEPVEKRILNPSIQGVPFFWGPRSLDPGNLQPLPSQVFYIWEIFVENIDPFIKVLHVPTIGRAIREAKGKFSVMGRGMEALMFAISLAAVTSLHENEYQVEENFGESRKTLFARLRLGTEQALSRAGVLNTTDISTVQAFIIYQDIAKQIDGQRATWTLVGLLVRIAIGMGLHRDGSHFSHVSPFDAEIRRRVWYHICLLDNRVGDCQVFNAGITENLFDTKQPSNLNDTDITPDMAVSPAPREGYTDSTFCILRCKMWRFARRFRSSVSIELSPNEVNTAHRLGMLTEIRKSLAEDLKLYLKPRENRFHFLIQTMIALELSKFDNMIHVANKFKPSGGGDESHKAFAIAIASLEYVFRLAEQPSTRQWGWYLYSSIQWHTMSTILVRLSTSPWGPVAEMTWGLAKKAFVHLSEGMSRDPMRQPLPELMSSVAKHRELQIQKLRANPTWVEKLARIRTIPVPVPALRDFSDGQEAFDTSAVEECLALEMNVSASQSDTAGSNPSQSFGISEGRDTWVDLTAFFSGRTEESDNFFQVPNGVDAHDGWAANEDLGQHPGLISINREHGDLLHDHEPWDTHVVSNDEEMGWLAWDNNLSTEGMP